MFALIIDRDEDKVFLEKVHVFSPFADPRVATLVTCQSTTLFTHSQWFVSQTLVEIPEEKNQDDVKNQAPIPPEAIIVPLKSK